MRCAVFWSIAVLFVLTGCATTSLQNQENSNKKLELKGLVLPTPSEQSKLDGELLQNLLLANFAKYSSDWQTSFLETAKAARKTGDWRLAKNATEIGFSLEKNYSKAYEMARVWNGLKPEDELASLYKIVSGIASNQLLNELSSASNFIANHSLGSDFALQALSELLRKQPNTSAIDLMVALEGQFSTSADFYYHATIISAWFEDSVRLKVFLEKALQLDPDHERSNVFKYRLIAIEQDDDAANLFLRSQIKRFPESKNLRNQHLNYLYSAQQYQEVIDLTDALLISSRSAKEDAEAAYLRGASFLQFDRLKEAEIALSQVLEINPDDQNTRLHLGRVYFADKKYDKALNVLLKITGGQQYFDASLIAARALPKVHDGEMGMQRALRKLNGLSANTKTKVVQRALVQSNLLIDANKSQYAMGYLSDAISAYPDDEKLLYARGLLASELKELAVAEADFKKMIALKPDNATALNALGYTLLDLTQRYGEAQKYIERALFISPESPYVLDSAGWLAYKQGNFEVALIFLTKAYEIDKNAEIAAHLGEVLYVSGQTEDALEIWQNSLLKNPDHKILIKAINRFSGT